MILAKDGNKPETIWVRAIAYIGANENIMVIKVQLLNEPYSDFGIHIHDIIGVVCFLDGSGERILAHIVKE